MGWKRREGSPTWAVTDNIVRAPPPPSIPAWVHAGHCELCVDRVLQRLELPGWRRGVTGDYGVALNSEHLGSDCWVSHERSLRHISTRLIARCFCCSVLLCYTGPGLNWGFAGHAESWRFRVRPCRAGMPLVFAWIRHRRQSTSSSGGSLSHSSLSQNFPKSHCVR